MIENLASPKGLRGFGSDNHSPVHPRILRAIVNANHDHAPSYGTDPWSVEAEKMFRRLFGENTESFFVFNGTAANVLSLTGGMQSYHAVLASRFSHLINDECGAVEKSIGCRVVPIATEDGKVSIADLSSEVVRRGDQHYSQARAISITQPTEVGTLYTLDEIRAIAEFAHTEGLFLHMDGARLVNAAAALNCDLAALTVKAGVDVLSLGGTKNGLLFGEAVLFFHPALAKDFRFKRKQLMQLPSKTRFLAAQFLEFLGTDLWQVNARHANEMAGFLASEIAQRGLSNDLQLTQKVQANAVFARVPKNWVAKLREVGFFYVWDERTFECRFMTSWDTTKDDIAALLDCAVSLKSTHTADARPRRS